MNFQTSSHVEWPTLGLFVLTYLVWIALVFWPLSSIWSVVGLSIVIAFHASLQHEAIHDHPFPSTIANLLIAWPPLTLFIPYLRYRDTHLAHHGNCELTDPFDDPESNYFSEETWEKRSMVCQRVLLANNTLAGRLLVGPIVGTATFLAGEFRNADRHVLRGWLWHLPAVTAVCISVIAAPLPFWVYLVAVYLALALLRIRTFLEHQAHELRRARSVIIEDRGPLALLFLNNNLHAVHHAHPGVPWYRLPSLYRRNKSRFLRQNEGYAYRSYGQVFTQYLFRRKDPVVHPLVGRRGT